MTAGESGAKRVFLLSPARIGGRRSEILFHPEAGFELALRVRAGSASVGEIYGFISGLYFRGKLAYSARFSDPPASVPRVLVIVPGLGLVPPETILREADWRRVGEIDIHETNEAYRTPLLRDAGELRKTAGSDCEITLLGSIATPKYTDPLLSIFEDQLTFPLEFVGRGDMSRGGLMLRRANSGEPLSYVRVRGAETRGRRAEKLTSEASRPADRSQSRRARGIRKVIAD